MTPRAPRRFSTYCSRSLSHHHLPLKFVRQWIYRPDCEIGEWARDCEFQDWDTILIPEDDRISFYRRRSIDALMTAFTNRTPAGLFSTPGCAASLEKTNEHRCNWPLDCSTHADEQE